MILNFRNGKATLRGMPVISKPGILNGWYHGEVWVDKLTGTICFSADEEVVEVAPVSRSRFESRRATAFTLGELLNNKEREV